MLASTPTLKVSIEANVSLHPTLKVSIEANVSLHPTLKVSIEANISPDPPRKRPTSQKRHPRQVVSPALPPRWPV